MPSIPGIGVTAEWVFPGYTGAAQRMARTDPIVWTRPGRREARQQRVWVFPAGVNDRGQARHEPEYPLKRAERLPILTARTVLWKGCSVPPTALILRHRVTGACGWVVTVYHRPVRSEETLDLLAVMLIAGIVWMLGTANGYRMGFRHGQERERMSRRIDELTGTERL